VEICRYFLFPPTLKTFSRISSFLALTDACSVSEVGGVMVGTTLNLFQAQKLLVLPLPVVVQVFQVQLPFVKMRPCSDLGKDTQQYGYGIFQCR
jgi:hypothetical protein